MRRLGILLLIAFAGCGPTPPTVTVNPAHADRPLSQQFTRAWFDTDAPTGDQVMLVDDPIEKAAPVDPGKPVQPMASTPVRQALSVRIHWRAPGALAADSIAATNAALDWYVYTDAGQPFGMAHYRGIGFVTIDTKADTAVVTIRNSDFKLFKRAGVVVDPFGTFSVDGTFTAVRDKSAAELVLKDLKSLDAHP